MHTVADLFDPQPEMLRDGMVLLRGFADADLLFADLAPVLTAAPLRQFRTPGGKTMSVAMTNCGARGWVSDTGGYRYTPTDPESGRPWPPIPARFLDLATRAAAAAGFPDFRPDACLINRYAPGTQLTAHQDRDEADFSHPIVSVSLGIPARFFVNLGDGRTGPTRSVDLGHGDVVAWGGPARLAYHGIRPLKPAHHPTTGNYRFNLTLRRAG